MENGLITKWCD